MPSFVRVLESKFWADLEDAHSLVYVPIEILYNVAEKKGKGTSYWKIEDSEKTSLMRMVGAIFSSRSTISSIRLGLVDENDLKKLGINALRTQSNNVKDKTFGETSHFDLEVDTLKKTIRLAGLIRKNIVTFSAKEVHQSFAASLNAGFFKIEDLSSELIISLAKSDKCLVLKSQSSI